MVVVERIGATREVNTRGNFLLSQIVRNRILIKLTLFNDFDGHQQQKIAREIRTGMLTNETQRVRQREKERDEESFECKPIMKYVTKYVCVRRKVSHCSTVIRFDTENYSGKIGLY